MAGAGEGALSTAEDVSATAGTAGGSAGNGFEGGARDRGLAETGAAAGLASPEAGATEEGAAEGEGAGLAGAADAGIPGVWRRMPSVGFGMSRVRISPRGTAGMSRRPCAVKRPLL